MRLIRKTALGATALAVAAALSGCSGDDLGSGRAERDHGEPRTIVQALQAAAKKTSEVRTARVELTMSVRGQTGGDMRMSGVMGWDPVVMDMTASGSALAQGGGPGEMRVLWVDNVMYMNVGEENEAFGGKPWMKMDLQAIAEKSGDANALESMTGGLQDMNQDPSQQMGLLLDSPSIKRVGEETIDGVATEHYSGTLTMEEALEANSSSDYLSAEEREKLLENMEKSGVKGFDIDVWVGERDFPAKIDMTMDSPEGELVISQTYSDYGTPVSVKAPPADQTADLVEMLEELGETAAPEEPGGF